MEANEAQAKDKELCEKYSIIRPTLNEELLPDLKICVEERMKTTKWKAEWIHDGLLARFLKAFQTVEGTMQALEDYCEWRLKDDVDTTAALTRDNDEDIKRQDTVGRATVFETFFDRCGRPIMLVHVKNHDRYHGNYPSLLRYVIWLMEVTAQKAEELSADKRFNLIFDLNGFSMRNMDFKYVKNFLNMLRYYYPERIAQAFIINYPWVFWGCWAIIKHWMNDVTQSKFIFAAYDQLNDFMDLEEMPLKVF
uniref:SEC14 family domain containing protein n=1 Tax=Clytia hemisphaerica TaxID=252671 RepID=A0A069DUJ2_9CNID